MKKRIIVLLIAIFMTFGSLGTIEAKKKTIKLNKTLITVERSKTKKLKLKNATSKKVKWTSSDKSIVTVKKGVVKAKRKVGTATITAKYKGKKYKCTVVVTYPTYTISPSSKPCNKKMLRYKQYRKYKATHCYYTIRSYLEKFEKAGGGTLVLKKGTYKLCNGLYIPSNVTIKCEKGVTLEKVNGKKYGLKNSITLFQLINPSFPKNGKKKKYGYNGIHNVYFIGNNTKINMHSIKKSIGISLGHNSNVMITGFNFVNMSYKGHFIELNSSKNVKVTNCTFNAGTRWKSGKKECINIDSCDKNTSGFNNKWSSHDKTCCKDITVTDNTFKNAKAAVGTHQVSFKNGKLKYHINIKVKNNTISNCGGSGAAYPIRMMAWKNAVVSNNTITNCKTTGIFAAGVYYPTISKNKIRTSAKKAIDVRRKYSCKKLAKAYKKHKLYSKLKSSKLTKNTRNGKTIKV